MSKKSNCQKTSEAYVKTHRTKALGAMATAGAALLALNLSTDANAAIVTGTEFEVNGFGMDSPTLPLETCPGWIVKAFDGKDRWLMYSYFSGAQMILTQPGSSNDIKLLGSGYMISAGKAFNEYGNWTQLGGQSGYIGVEFYDLDSNSEPLPTYYGWVYASVNVAGDELTLHSWAYEDIEGKGIAAGDTGSAVPVPGSLALLASGAAGLAAFRRRKSGEA